MLGAGVVTAGPGQLAGLPTLENTELGAGAAAAGAGSSRSFPRSRK
jgi:hypothetical protein